MTAYRTEYNTKVLYIREHNAQAHMLDQDTALYFVGSNY